MKTAVVGVVCAVIGFLAGWVLAPGGAADPPQERESASVAIESTAGSEQTPAARPGSESANEQGEADAEAQLASALDAIELDPLPPFDGVITGSVRAKDGTPIEGVLVTVIPHDPWDDRPDDPRDEDDIPLAELVGITARYHVWERRMRREVHTDAAGGFRFEACADTTHSIRARKDGFRISKAKSSRGKPTRPGSHVEYVARRYVSVTALIELPGGGSPETAMVAFKGTGSSRTHRWAPDRTVFKVDPGTYDVSGTIGQYGEFESEPVEMTFNADEPEVTIVLHPHTQPVIHGRVVFPDGEDGRHAAVWLLPLPEGDEFDEAQLKTSGKSHRPHGNQLGFRFTDLRPGRYVLGAARSAVLPVAVHEIVHVTDRAVQQDLVLREFAREDYVRVVVKGPDGMDLDHVQVLAQYNSSAFSMGGMSAIDRDADGAYRVPRMRPEREDDDGTHFIRAHSQRLGVVEAIYEPGPRAEVHLRFEPAAKVTLVPNGHEGTRYAGNLEFALFRITEGGATRGFTPLGYVPLEDQSEQVWKHVQPGTYELQLFVNPQRRVRIGTQRVVVTSGEQRVDVSIPRLYQLRVRGAGSFANATSQSREPFISSWGVEVDGVTLIDFLPAGEYTIRTEKDTKEDVVVPTTSELHF